MQNDNAASSCLTTNQHSLPMPGMPRVGDLSKIGFMGVECLGCTIADARMPVLVREFQSWLLRDRQARSITDTNYGRIVG